MLKQRVITALVILPLAIAVVWFGKLWFAIFIALWGLAATLEFYRIVSKNNIPVLTYFGAVWSILFIVYSYFNYNEVIPTLLTSAIVLPLVYFLLRRNKERAFAGWAWTVAGILYVGWLLSYLILLRAQPDGRNWMFFSFLVTFGSDSAAYFIGRTWGKNPMAPSVSPKKTWEGAIGGVCGAVIMGLFFLLPTPLKLPVPYWHILILSVIVSIFGQVGDLAESLFKRNMNIKDSSKLLPGHGGFLDRMDSVVFAGVVVYYYIVWVIPLL